MGTAESNIRESIIQQFVEPPYGGNTTEEFVVPQTEGNVAEVIITPSARGSNLERHASADNSSASEPRTTSCVVSDVDDHQGAEYQFFLSGEKEIPFTYLASLLAKWTAEKDREPVIHGKIKVSSCFRLLQDKRSSVKCCCNLYLIVLQNQNFVFLLIIL